MPFLDTNILVYAYDKIGDPRATLAREIILGRFVVGVQTLNELVNVGRRRLGWDWTECNAALADIELLAAEIWSTELIDQKRSLDVAQRYRLSIFDALMLAIALRAECTAFYSEDMQHGLVIDGKMTITNPFL